MKKIRIIDSGLINYRDGIKLQKKIVQQRLKGEVPDTLILCEHYPVITIGRKGKKSDLLVSEKFLKEKKVGVFEIERGGEATCHCPGQLAGYPIFDLQHHEMDLHKFLRNIEEVIVNTLDEIGVKSCRREGYTGVWIYNGGEFKKIAFIGICASKWVTFHGFSLNVDCDLTPFSWIVPCGLKGIQITSVKETVQRAACSVNMEDIKKKIIENFAKVFNPSIC
jgi:lipoate-protein ligase B